MSNDKKNDSSNNHLATAVGGAVVTAATTAATGMGPGALAVAGLTAIGPIGWLALGGAALFGAIIASDDD